jgi:hypothetical protein
MKVLLQSWPPLFARGLAGAVASIGLAAFALLRGESPKVPRAAVLRGFAVDGKPDAVSKVFRENVRIYSLSKANDPPKMQFVNGSKVPFNTVHANRRPPLQPGHKP